MNKQVLTIRHGIARDQRHNSAKSAEFKYCKNLFHLVFVLGYTGFEFYGSCWMWSIQLNFKSLKEGHRKAVEGYYPTNKC